MLGRGMLSNPFLAEGLVSQKDTPSTEELWRRLLPLLERYLTLVIEDLSERHVHGRIKQWLNMLRRHFPQAEVLFTAIRSERNPHLILQRLQQIQRL